MDLHHLVFAAAFPDDPLFNDEGDILVPSGRELADSVVKTLNQREWRCSEVTQRDYYGWEFRFTFRHTTVSAVLQRIDKWILTLASRPSLKNILSRRQTSSIGQIAEEVAQALKADLPCEDMIVYSDDDCPY